MSVWTWFQCDVVGCEVRDERMVKVMVHSGSLFTWDQSSLPDGWAIAHGGSVIFCPEHARLIFAQPPTAEVAE